MFSHPLIIMNKETYAEAVGEEPFDWNKLLEETDTNSFEWNIAMVLSDDWVTCACGNQCKAIPRNRSGMPVDDELAELGLDFNHHIKTYNREAAKDTLRRIEARSAYLINEINRQQEVIS